MYVLAKHYDAESLSQLCEFLDSLCRGFALYLNPSPALPIFFFFCYARDGTQSCQAHVFIVGFLKLLLGQWFSPYPIFFVFLCVFV